MPLQRLHHLPRLARLPCSEPEPGPELDCVVAGACGKERTRQTHGHAHARHAVLVSLPDVAAHFLASPARARCRNPLEEHAPSVEARSIRRSRQEALRHDHSNPHSCPIFPNPATRHRRRMLWAPLVGAVRGRRPWVSAGHVACENDLLEPLGEQISSRVGGLGFCGAADGRMRVEEVGDDLAQRVVGEQLESAAAQERA
mmetsp:Transcript_38078/g.89733  ORF Transcript_38078/g.89733 Transcript_38078/m.89733 type:complete len:200 (-) Transcript_38078:321-920(-)